MAKAEHTLLAGIIFVDPVLAAHIRVGVTTDLAQPVESGAEPGAAMTSAVSRRRFSTVFSISASRV
jgi:hypothetical protein